LRPPRSGATRPGTNRRHGGRATRSWQPRTARATTHPPIIPERGQPGMRRIRPSTPSVPSPMFFYAVLPLLYSGGHPMNRRQFLGAGAATAALGAVPAFGAPLPSPPQDQPRRVGLIGCGWYGKCDLFRLIQVAPVEVVSLCDVDSRMLSECADMVAARQASKKTPHTYGDYRNMLKEKDLDVVVIGTPDHWHALPMIAA